MACLVVHHGQIIAIAWPPGEAATINRKTHIKRVSSARICFTIPVTPREPSGTVTVFALLSICAYFWVFTSAHPESRKMEAKNRIERRRDFTSEISAVAWSKASSG